MNHGVLYFESTQPFPRWIHNFGMKPFISVLFFFVVVVVCLNVFNPTRVSLQIGLGGLFGKVSTHRIHTFRFDCHHDMSLSYGCHFTCRCHCYLFCFLLAVTLALGLKRAVHSFSYGVPNGP